MPISSTRLSESLAQSPTDVLLTIDTEVSTPLYHDWQTRKLDREVRRDIYGETTDGEFGLLYQLRVLREHGLSATFFVDPFFSMVAGKRVLQCAVDNILEYGQDVQLHIHTEWLPYMTDNPLGSRIGYSINRFKRDEQEQLLEKAKGILVAAGAKNICAFRAGNWGANNDTLVALASAGIHIDSSYNPTHVECEIVLESRRGFAPRLQSGVLELPLTVFCDGIHRPRPLQITSASFSEYVDLLCHSRRMGFPCVVFCTHSMELIRAKRWPVHPDWIVIRRFERLCKFLSDNRSRFRTLTCSDIQNGCSRIAPTDNLLLPPLRAKKLSTFRRLVGQAKRRVW